MSVSGTLTSGPTNEAGKNSGSYSIKTSDGFNGQGSFSMNVITGTMTALTFGGQSIITPSSGGLRVSPPGNPVNPFSVNWTAKDTGGNGDISGTYSVDQKNGRVHSGTFNFNILDPKGVRSLTTGRLFQSLDHSLILVR